MASVVEVAFIPHRLDNIHVQGTSVHRLLIHSSSGDIVPMSCAVHEVRVVTGFCVQVCYTSKGLGTSTLCRVTACLAHVDGPLVVSKKSETATS